MTLLRTQLAARVALDIPDGAYVNLGIGVPTLVADHLPVGREIVLHTENGMLGMGPAAAPGYEDEDLINAGKVYVTELPGAVYFHHADSFGMMRGGHIDYCVMGAYQVSERGDLANWRTTSPKIIPGVGGAMDLAAGARHVYVVMNLFAKDGTSKLVPSCTYPITGFGCVERVYTDHGVFRIASGPLEILDLFSDVSVAQLSQRIGLPLVDAR